MTGAVVVPPVCELRHTCHHLTGAQTVVAECIAAGIVAAWVLLFAAARLSEWWCKRCRKR